MSKGPGLRTTATFHAHSLTLDLISSCSPLNCDILMSPNSVASNLFGTRDWFSWEASVGRSPALQGSAPRLLPPGILPSLPQARTLPNRRDRLLQKIPPPSRRQPRRRKKAPFRRPSNSQRTRVARATVPGLPSAFAWAPPVTRTTATRSGQPSTPSPVPLATIAGPTAPWTPSWSCPQASPQTSAAGSDVRDPTSQGLSPPPARLLASPGRGALLPPWQGGPGLGRALGVPARSGQWDRPVLWPRAASRRPRRSHSCVGLSNRHGELFKMQAMSLPC
ncbi:splicing factor, proline- and glutamine-rich-like [Hylobates moloch]|uniref:splicing factor, proline- and glutamine-rich-like n=1 Tax=Hylobates moloch TaxID=81572 RepID=UPI0026747F23|nr:splicing factor, proline- and glutamine-rich-like [Hylobates moloch]